MANIALKDYFKNSVDMKLLKASVNYHAQKMYRRSPGGLEHQVGEDGISIRRTNTKDWTG